MQQAFKTCNVRCVFGILKHVEHGPLSIQTFISCFKLMCILALYFHLLFHKVHSIAHASTVQNFSLAWKRHHHVPAILLLLEFHSNAYNILYSSLRYYMDFSTKSAPRWYNSKSFSSSYRNAKGDFQRNITIAITKLFCLFLLLLRTFFVFY